MKKNNEWAITFDVLKMGEGGEPAEVYNSLEQKLGTFLEKQFVNCEFVDDSCDGEEYAVRFKVFSDKSLDKRDLASKQIPIGNSIWEVSGLEIREFKKVYIEEQFKDLSDRYGQNRNPFEDLTVKLIDEAIKCYSEGLYSYVSLSTLFLAQTQAR